MNPGAQQHDAQDRFEIHYFRTAWTHSDVEAAFRNPFFQRLFMKNAAIAVVFDDRKENYLLVKRRDVPIWVLPGGGIDPGESPEQAAIREVQEETGVTARIVRKVAVYTPTGRLSSETHLFECAIISGELTTGDESRDVKFFPLRSYPAPVFQVHERWVKDTCQNCPHVIVKPVEGLSWYALLKTVLRHPVLASRYLLTRIGIHWNSK